MAKRKKERQRESGLPGGGAGRRDEVGGSGVYPMSGPHPSGDAPIVGEPSWGQGERGAAGYEESGESEVFIPGAIPEKCRDVMSKDPACCALSDTVVDAAQLMRDLEIGPIPIVRDTRNKQLVGIVTDRDLAIKVVAEGRDPEGTTLEEIMTGDPVTCSPDDDLDKVIEAMAAHQVRRIPVVDNSGRIVGIIAQADIALRVNEPGMTAEVVEEISRPKTMTGGGGG